MVEIYFSDSLGNREKLASLGWLKARVLNGSDEFWEGATGDCGLSYAQSGVTTSSLGLVGRTAYGFMLDHSYAEANERTHTLRHGEHTGETVEAAIGGNPNLYYREHFVPKEIAWEAIEYFLKTGDRKPDLTWEIAEMPDQEF
jgi:hypothetical protein